MDDKLVGFTLGALVGFFLGAFFIGQTGIPNARYKGCLDAMYQAPKQVDCYR